MAIKQTATKKHNLPFLAPALPTDPDNQYYNPAYLCKPSSYRELCLLGSVNITLQALYERCRRRTIPCVYIDGHPFIVLYLPYDQIKALPTGRLLVDAAITESIGGNYIPRVITQFTVEAHGDTRLPGSLLDAVISVRKNQG